MEAKELDVAKKLLQAAQRLDRLSEEQNDPWFQEHAALCRDAVVCIRQLQESQARFSLEEEGLLHKLTEREILSLPSGVPLYIVHRNKGNWKDWVDQVFSFLDMNDLKLEGGAVLPLEEHDTVWSAYRFWEDIPKKQDENAPAAPELLELFDFF